MVFRKIKKLAVLENIEVDIKTQPVYIDEHQAKMIKLQNIAEDIIEIYGEKKSQILCNLDKTCDKLVYYPDSAILTMDTLDTCNAIDFLERKVERCVESCNMPIEEVSKEVENYFVKEKIRVLPKGLQGEVYKWGRIAQDCIPMYQTSQALGHAKLLGMKGIKLVQYAPLTTVGALYVTAMGCSFLAQICGDNVFGTSLTRVAWITSRPMKVFEITANNLILAPLSRATGFPMILNGTDVMLAGKGINYTELYDLFKKERNDIIKSALTKANTYISAIINKL